MAMDRIPEISKRLARAYPNTRTALKFQTPFQLLVATILSAQSTDEQVNRATPNLFARMAGPAAFNRASQAEIEKLIGSINFYRNKAGYLKRMSGILINRHGGKVPRNMEELVRLPGVARKTANVVLSQVFRKNEGVVVDTHVARVSQRLGLTRETDPVKIETDLMAILPQRDWGNFAFRLILHGRWVCQARKPACAGCCLEDLCPSSLLKKES